MSSVNDMSVAPWAGPISALQQAILHNDAAEVMPLINAEYGVDSARRVAIYAHAYRARLHDTLADTYERVHAWLGDENFAALAAAYIAAYPPQSPTLRDFGAHFASLLTTHYPNDVEVTELGQLDWALRNAFDAPDAKPLSAAALGDPNLDWESVKLVFHPSVARLRFQMNTLSLWHAMNTGDTPPACVALAQPLEIVVWRKEWQPHFASMTPLESYLVDQLMQGVGFTLACTQAEQAFGAEQVQTELGELLAEWFNNGLIISL